MQITEITASAGRTFNHPHEDYSNLKPHVTLKAVLVEGDDPIACAKALQQQAEQLCEDQKRNMLKALEDIYQIGEAQTRMIGLAKQLRAAQDELDMLRKQWPGLTQPQLIE
jgi:hypothetical protein